MNETHFEPTRLIGIALPHKTSNQGGQASKDCGMLWQQFEKEEIFDKIPDKKGHSVYAVYHNYEGDHTQPYSYFIGCPVEDDAPVPAGLEAITIPGGTFQKFTAKGEMPGCIANTWQNIWNSKIPRAYHADFEVYDERTADFSNIEVDVYVSVKKGAKPETSLPLGSL